MAQRDAGIGSYASRAMETAGNGMGNVKAQIREAVDTAADRVDTARESIGDRLADAADTIREQANAGSEAMLGAAESAAGKLDASASYIKSRDVGEMMQDLWRVVKRHPTQSLLLAGLVGFLIARALRSDD